MSRLRLTTLSLVALLLTGCNAYNSLDPIAIVDLDAVAHILGRDELIKQKIESANMNSNQQLEQLAANLHKQVDSEITKLCEKPSKEEEHFMQLLQNANA